jgi:hypothetical protein
MAARSARWGEEREVCLRYLAFSIKHSALIKFTAKGNWCMIGIHMYSIRVNYFQRKYHMT